MKLSINIVHRGGYVKAGDELPSDFVLPEHLDRFAVHDGPASTMKAGETPPQGSRATSIQVEGLRLGGGSKLANSVVEESSGTTVPDDSKRYSEGEEEFVPKWRLKRKKKGNEL